MRWACASPPGSPFSLPDLPLPLPFYTSRARRSGGAGIPPPGLWEQSPCFLVLGDVEWRSVPGTSSWDMRAPCGRRSSGASRFPCSSTAKWVRAIPHLKFEIWGTQSGAWSTHGPGPPADDALAFHTRREYSNRKVRAAWCFHPRSPIARDRGHTQHGPEDLTGTGASRPFERTIRAIKAKAPRARGLSIECVHAYCRFAISASRADFGGRVSDSGSVASGSSTRLRWSMKVGFSVLM
jgi:hypothetical protein